MAQPKPVDEALDSVANGEAIDWDVLDRGVAEEDRELLKCLRLLAEIADVHRGIAEDPAAAETVERQPPPVAACDPVASTDDRPEMWGRYRLRERVGDGSFGGVYR